MAAQIGANAPKSKPLGARTLPFPTAGPARSCRRRVSRRPAEATQRDVHEAIHRAAYLGAEGARPQKNLIRPQANLNRHAFLTQRRCLMGSRPTDGGSAFSGGP
jgi:hypothetical protein